MILLWPALLVAAVAVARRSPHDGRGSGWLAAWALAGALFTFSLAAGFSFGLLVLPLAAAALLWVASRSPRRIGAAAFAAGVVAVVALLVALAA